ncbi:MAG: hypothetical protein ABIM50_10540 [Novosphingobium sp.]
MSHCYYHALSSVRKWGGEVGDYLPLHQWFDQSKAIIADPRHRALRHHAEGIFMLEALFGETIVNSADRVVPVRLVGELHVLEDLGTIPSFADWARLIEPRPWMMRGAADLAVHEGRKSMGLVTVGEALVEAGLDHSRLAQAAKARSSDGGEMPGERAAA